MQRMRAHTPCLLRTARFLRAIAAALTLLAAPALAQDEPPNGVLLVAKPGLPDPRFSRTVVLVTQTADSHTVGVILNRPTTLKLQDLRPGSPGGEAPVYFGGPVMDNILIALFKSDAAPAASAFHVLKGVYLSMHPAVVEPLLEQPGAKLRLFAGFSGWAPRQLEAELEQDGWFLVPASEDLVFRKDTTGMWEELSEQAARKKAALYSKP